MNRTKHTFQFLGKEIAEGARKEAEYHRTRHVWWADAYQQALREAKTAGVVVREYDVTGGKRAEMGLDPSLQARINEAYSKRESHRQSADALTIEAMTYGSQGERTFELDGEDVMHWRLAGGAREP